MHKKRFPYIRILLCLGVTIGLLALLRQCWAGPNTPADALRRAQTAIKDGAYAKASSELEKAQEDQRLGHWVLLAQAQLLSRQDKPQEAVELLKTVPRSSAAWPDALLLLLKHRKHCADLVLGQEIARVMALAPEIGRKELLPELYLGQAQEALSANRTDLGQALLQHVRENYPRTPYADEALIQVGELRANLPEQTSPSPAELTAETKLFLLNREHEKALETLYQARTKLTKGSLAHAETLLLEEQVLRKQKRHQEADHVLTEAAAIKHEEIASEALLRLAKNAWNVNNHQQALTLIGRIKEKYPKSSVVSSASYIESRVLEEMALIPEAKETYRWTAENTSDPLIQLRSLLRLGFVHMRFKSHIQAAKTFHEVRSLAHQVLTERQSASTTESNDVTSLRPTKIQPRDQASHGVLKDHYFAALYWEAVALSLLSPEEQEELKFQVEAPSVLFNRLEQLDTAGYYGFRGVQKLDSLQREQVEEAQQQTDTYDCVLPVDSYLTKLALALKQANLEDIAQKEIDWYFGVMSTRTVSGDSDQRNTNSDPTTERITAWVHLSTTFGLPRRGIRIARQFMLSRAPVALTSCSAALVQLAHPFMYRETMENMADKYGVPFPLILAVARTESHFDRLAVSPVGASGIMQLMPKTAAQLGLADDNDIFEASTNIDLGTKHLRDLLKRYLGNTVYSAAAYNAGHSPVDLWRERLKEVDAELWIEFIGYPETKMYVKRVLAAQHQYSKRLMQEHRIQ